MTFLRMQKVIMQGPWSRILGFEGYDNCQDYVDQDAGQSTEQRQHRNDPDESGINVKVLRDAAGYAPISSVRLCCDKSSSS